MKMFLDVVALIGGIGGMIAAIVVKIVGPTLGWQVDPKINLIFLVPLAIALIAAFMNSLSRGDRQEWVYRPLPSLRPPAAGLALELVTLRHQKVGGGRNRRLTWPEIWWRKALRRWRSPVIHDRPVAEAGRLTFEAGPPARLT